MNSSIAVYPSVQWRQQTVLWADYLEKAGEYGFGEVFSSIHLPELALEDQVEMLEELARLTNHLGMELTVERLTSCLRIHRCARGSAAPASACCGWTTVFARNRPARFTTAWG